MNLSEIITSFRNDTHDLASPPLWTDEELTEYANDGEREACRRARLIIDSEGDMCVIDMGIGDTTIDLDPTIIFVKRVRVTGQTLPLKRASWRDMDDSISNWEAHTGKIDKFISDWQTGKLRVYRIPTAPAILNLTVIRLPLVDMANDEDIPEIHLRYHASLLNWIKYRAYMKRDADTMDEALALKYLALFEEEFGKRSSAVDEEWIEREQQADPYDGTR